jgi:protocatechuate 3,4-dioxygenase beta subunit
MKLTVGLFLLASAVAQAAENPPPIDTTGTVNVLVTDRRGNPLRSARVMVNGTEHKAVTNNTGRVVFTNMTPGEYTLRVERNQYITFEKDFVVNGETKPVPVVAAISPLASLAARPAVKSRTPRLIAGARR